MKIKQEKAKLPFERAKVKDDEKKDGESEEAWWLRLAAKKENQ